ncbi:hypothetical protein Bca4012_025382 [Brassica carinata]
MYILCVSISSPLWSLVLCGYGLRVKEDKLHCSVKKDLVGQFEQTVEQGVTKVMVNFIVTRSGSHRSSVWPMELFLNSCMISDLTDAYVVLCALLIRELIGEKVTY